MEAFCRLLSQILNQTYRRVHSLAIRDLSSGFRMYRRATLNDLTLVACGSGRTHPHLFRFGWALLKTLARMWRLRNSVASADHDDRAFDGPIPLQRYSQRRRHWIVLEYLAPQRARGSISILDVDCGSIRIVEDLPQAIGMDVVCPSFVTFAALMAGWSKEPSSPCLFRTKASTPSSAPR